MHHTFPGSVGGNNSVDFAYIVMMHLHESYEAPSSGATKVNSA